MLELLDNTEDARVREGERERARDAIVTAANVERMLKAGGREKQCESN